MLLETHIPELLSALKGRGKVWCLLWSKAYEVEPH